MLRAGRLAAGWDGDDEQMSAFVEDVWSSLESCTETALERLDGPRVRTHRIGPSAARWSCEPGDALRDYSVDVYYRVRD